MPKDLRSFLKQLEDANEIIRIKKPVDPTVNLGGLAWQGENKLGKATYFENLVGYEGWNAISYADASRKRLSLALNTTPKEFIPHLRGLLKKGPTPKQVVETGPVKDIIKVGDKVNLYDLPIHQMSNMDGGRYIGGGIGIVKDPDTGVQNASLHRHQLKGENKFGILMHPKRHMDLIYAGGSHVVVIQFTPRIEGESKDVLLAALSSPYIHPKIAIAVDDDIDPHDPKELFWSLSTRVDPQRDVFIIGGTHGHNLDASLELITAEGVHPQVRRGSKMGIDATKPPVRNANLREFFTRSVPKGWDDVDIRDFVRRT